MTTAITPAIARQALDFNKRGAPVLTTASNMSPGARQLFDFAIKYGLTKTVKKSGRNVQAIDFPQWAEFICECEAVLAK